MNFRCDKLILAYYSSQNGIVRCGNNFLSLSTQFLQQCTSDWLQLKAYSALHAKSLVRDFAIFKRVK